jgi:hypothetical protein
MRWIVVSDQHFARIFVVRDVSEGRAEIARVPVSMLSRLLERAWAAGRFTELALMMPASLLADVKFKMGPARQSIHVEIPHGPVLGTIPEIERDAALLASVG